MITATETTTQKIELDVRSLPKVHADDYALTSAVGETVGWLQRKPSGRLEVTMIDKSFEISGTVWDGENGVINVRE